MTGTLRLWMIVTAFLWVAMLVLQERFPGIPLWPGLALFVLLLLEWTALLVLTYRTRQK